MKKILILLLFATNYINSQEATYFNFSLTDINTQEEIHFSNILEKYNLNKDKPTILITWSYKFCGINCTDLINRYNLTDTSLVNLIVVNIDQVDEDGGYGKFKSQKELDFVLKESNKKWKKSINFHGFNKSNSNGISSVFSVNSTPLILSFDKNNKMSLAYISYNFHPYRYYTSGITLRDNLNNYIWNSPEDLTELAQVFANNDKSIKETYENALKYIERSKLLLENGNFDNDFYYTERGKKNAPNLKKIIQYKNVYAEAFLLFKLESNTKALKKAKESIDLINELEEYYYWSFDREKSSERSSKLLNDIIDKL